MGKAVRAMLAVPRMGTQPEELSDRKRNTESSRRRRTATVDRTRRRKARTKRERDRIQMTVLDMLPVGTQPEELSQNEVNEEPATLNHHSRTQPDKCSNPRSQQDTHNQLSGLSLVASWSAT